jgi:hypothetical protein
MLQHWKTGKISSLSHTIITLADCLSIMLLWETHTTKKYGFFYLRKWNKKVCSITMVASVWGYAGVT